MGPGTRAIYHNRLCWWSIKYYKPEDLRLNTKYVVFRIHKNALPFSRAGASVLDEAQDMRVTKGKNEYVCACFRAGYCETDILNTFFQGSSQNDGLPAYF